MQIFVIMNICEKCKYAHRIRSPLERNDDICEAEEEGEKKGDGLAAPVHFVLIAVFSVGMNASYLIDGKNCAVPAEK